MGLFERLRKWADRSKATGACSRLVNKSCDKAKVKNPNLKDLLEYYGARQSESADNIVL